MSNVGAVYGLTNDHIIMLSLVSIISKDSKK